MQPPQQHPINPPEHPARQPPAYLGVGPAAVPACACCGATTHLLAGDDTGYTLFCLECLWPVDLDDPYVELGGSG